MHNLFKFKKNNQYAIKRWDSIRNPNSLEALTKEILRIDQEIANTYKDLLEVQIVKFRASFPKSSNWLNKLQKQVYWSSIENSSSFHTRHLISLYNRRRRVQEELDRVSGNFWKKRIYNWLIWSFLFFIIIFICGTILMSLLSFLYLIPFLGIISIIFYFLRN